MEIPWERVDAETLHAIIEDFVTREGTDYGAKEVSLDRKVDQVMAQLRLGSAFLTYDSATETVSVNLRD
jgi:uncharacterized protein YheU (UPF0270 family)